MKKALKSLAMLAFCFVMIMSTAAVSLAAPGKFTLKASAAPTSITLTWTKSDGADKYIVQRYKGSRWYTEAELEASKTSHTIKKLTTGATYTYRICAVDEDGLIDSKTYTDKVAATTAVPKVTSLKGTQYNYNTVKLSWKKISGVSGYIVYKYNTKTKKWDKVKTVSSKYNYAYIKSLKNGTTYKFRVKAYYKGSKTLYGAISSTVSVKAAVPAATVKTSVTYNSVKLSWNKVNDATGYRIYKYDSAKKKWVTAVKSTTKTSYTFKDLKTGTTYSYRVKAYQKVGKNTYWGSYKTIKATPALSKPASFKETASSLTSLTFTWGKVSGAAGYKVYRYNADTKKWDLVLKNTKERSFTDKNLSPATRYSYRVKAYRKVGSSYKYSPNSSTFRVTTESVNAIGEIKLLSTNQTSINLTWDNIGADGYELYNAVNGDKIVSTAYTTYSVTGLKPGKTYAFKLRAYFTENGKNYYTDYSKTLSASTNQQVTEPNPEEPTTKPTTEPTTKPTTKPTTEPTTKPTTEPTTEPTTKPTTKPTTEPTTKPTTKPTTEPTTKPTTKPTAPSTTQPVAPAKVTGLKVTSSTDSTLNVSWDTSKNATNYKLSYAKKGSNNWTDIPTNRTYYLITGLEAGTTYEINVTAANGSTLGRVSDTITASTTAKLPEAEKVLTATSLSDTTVKLTWKALPNAVSYDLQYYSHIDGWMTVPGAKGLTVLTHTDTQPKGYGYLYRVVGYNASGNEVAVSEPTVGTTKSLTVTQDKYSVTITWDKVSNASSYSLMGYIPGLGTVPIKGFTKMTANSAKVYLAPGDIHSFILVSNHSDNSSKIVFTGLSVYMPELDAADTSDKGVNAKLLYLERAINKTKYTPDEITLKYNSVSDYQIYYLKSTIPLLSGEYSGTDNVQRFFDKYNDDTSEAMNAVGSDVYNENIRFSRGTGQNAKGKIVYLKYMLEPATDSSNYYLASIYGTQNPSNWKNGFSKVDVTKNTDGSYNYTVVIKQETLKNSTDSVYHKGIFESVGSIANSMDAEIKNATIGATTITAKIGSDGILQTYKVDSPFDADMSIALDLNGLPLGSINMKIKGKGNVNYEFTK